MPRNEHSESPPKLVCVTVILLFLISFKNLTPLFRKHTTLPKKYIVFP